MIIVGEVIEFSLAEEVQEEWDNYMEDGDTIPDATTQILEQYSDSLEEKEKMLLYVALGIIQVELEQIDERIKEVVSEVIGTKDLEECLLDDSKETRKLLQLLKKRCR